VSIPWGCPPPDRLVTCAAPHGRHSSHNTR
jgi:hypothetical protein